MSGDSNAPWNVLRRWGFDGKELRLAQGVVGKTSVLSGMLMFLWIVVVLRLGSDPVMNLFLLGAAGIASVVLGLQIRRAYKFAEENPAVALLEGAHLLAYQQFSPQAKGLPDPSQNSVLIDPSRPIPELNSGAHNEPLTDGQPPQPKGDTP